MNTPEASAGKLVIASKAKITNANVIFFRYLFINPMFFQKSLRVRRNIFEFYSNLVENTVAKAV